MGYPFLSSPVNLKPAFLLLALCHTASAAALGLGEINVRSHLGQPLHATVALLGAPAEATAACFSLEASEDGIAPPPRAQLDIEQSGAQTLLHIRTLQPVNDPVAQFVLVSDCEVRLRRDYVVLLDPPAPVTAAVSQDVPAAVTPTAAAPLAAPAPRASRPQRKTQRAAAATRPSAARAPRPAAAPLAQAGTAPRLVLSGKRSSPQPADAPAALHPDTHLPDPARPHPASLTATELSDENTALSRKLAHLEAQLAALQQRYAELETRQVAAPATVTPPPEQPPQWPVYLLILGLLTAGIALVAGLLRRSRLRQPSILMDGIARSDAMPMTLADITAWPQAEPLFAPQRMPEIAPPPPRNEGTEVKEDILDQAEVFMAHGHGDLAIHLLQEHLREAPTESPVPWLLLLDLLHRGGDTEGYAAASAECRRYFNVNLTGHPISQDNETGEGLEAYPHLLEQLVNVWSTPDINAFFHDLIHDNRGGTRMGFDPGAYRDILLLRAIAQDALPLAA
jgi:Tfp pilus assembly protein FimV